MSLTQTEIQTLFEEHRRETDERFQRILTYTEEGRAKQVQTETRLEGINTILETVADNLKELSKIVHKEPSKAPYFQIIGAVGLILGMMGTLIVGYVQREVTHNASQADITLEWSRETSSEIQKVIQHMDERSHWMEDRVVELEKQAARGEVSRKAIGDYAKEHSNDYTRHP